MTKSSPPMLAMSAIIWSIVFSLMLKYTPSQLLSRTRRSWSPCWSMYLRPQRWKLRLAPLRPSLEKVKASTGVVKVSPFFRW